MEQRATDATLPRVDAGASEIDVNVLADEAPAVLACRNLSRWHGEVMAVNDLTLEFRAGVTGLLGPNGAGKTTLFRMAMGLAKPSSGSIRVLGEDPWGNADVLRRIGYVPDGPPPWPTLTPRQAAVRMGRLAGMTAPQAEDAAQAALARVKLDEHADDRRVGQLSRGMAQRLKFAFATLEEPQLMLLDEPLFATDPLTRRDLIEVIQWLGERGVSIVLSTHVLSDVEALTERVALMAHGRLLAHGEIGRIRDLLDKHPRAVRVGTTAPRELGHALWGLPSVLSLEATEGGVLVRTRAPQAFFEDLQRALGKGDIPFSSIVSLDEDLESIFRYVVSDR